MSIDTNKHRPVIAILRGLTPDECLPVTKALIQAGISLIEVPMNSPQALSSVCRMQQEYGDKAVFGAGTLTTNEQLNILADCGADLAISPHCDPELIRYALSLDLTPCPGVLTPSEAFAAIRAGAVNLKLFPASLLTVAGFKALKAVLPAEIRCWAVGGVSGDLFGEWLAAGITGFGVGSALYKPGWSPTQVQAAAETLVQQYEEARCHQ